MEKLEIHETPSKNVSGIYFQSVSTSKSNSYLFANAYGETEQQAEERVKLISCAPEMLELLNYLNNCGGLGYEKHSRIEALIKKATTI